MAKKSISDKQSGKLNSCLCHHSAALTFKVKRKDNENFTARVSNSAWVWCWGSSRRRGGSCDVTRLEISKGWWVARTAREQRDPEHEPKTEQFLLRDQRLMKVLLQDKQSSVSLFHFSSFNDFSSNYLHFHSKYEGKRVVQLPEKQELYSLFLLLTVTSHFDLFEI